MAGTPALEYASESRTEESTTDGDEQEEPTSEQEADWEDGEMKRVNISIHPVQHRKLTEFAEERSLNFSELARRGAQMYKSQAENDGIRREIQPLVSAIDQQNTDLNDYGEKVERVLEKISQLEQESKVLGSSSSKERSDSELAGRIRKLLAQEGSLTITEIKSQTEFSRGEIQRGLDTLRNSFAVREVEGSDGQPRWRCV